MTANTDTAADHIAALTATLVAQGWTYLREIYTDPQWRSQVHELQSPNGLLRLDASKFPNGNTIARLSAEAVCTDPNRAPGWMVDLHEVSLAVALAAVKAATGPSGAPYPTQVAVSAALSAQGWRQPPDVIERSRLIERVWESPDGERYVSWNPADLHDEGGWSVGRPGPSNAPTQISQHTPAAVIAALALTD
jgi:hypothetical protein